MISIEAVAAKAADWRPDDGRQTLTIADESGAELAVTADRWDSVGCQAWEIEWRPGLPSDFALADRGRQIAERLTALAERLRVVEVDAARGEALLRGDSPAADDPVYFELRLRASGRAGLHRFRGVHQAGSRRQQVAFPLTHEALARLGNELGQV